MDTDLSVNENHYWVGANNFVVAKLILAEFAICLPCPELS